MLKADLKSKAMRKVKNWLLPIVFALVGSIEMFFGLFSELVNEMGLPSYYTLMFRIVALFITVVVTKKQPPSLKAARKTRYTRRDTAQDYEKPI